MTEKICDTRRLRDKYELTLPIKIREFLNVEPGDLIGLETNENGVVCIHKLETFRIPNNGEGIHSNPISPTQKKDNGETEKDV